MLLCDFIEGFLGVQVIVNAAKQPPASLSTPLVEPRDTALPAAPRVQPVPRERMDSDPLAPIVPLAGARMQRIALIILAGVPLFYLFRRSR